jgi:hypothetical protein
VGAQRRYEYIARIERTMLVAIVRGTAAASAQIVVVFVVARIVGPTRIEVVHTDLPSLKEREGRAMAVGAQLDALNHSGQPGVGRFWRPGTGNRHHLHHLRVVLVWPLLRKKR